MCTGILFGAGYTPKYDDGIALPNGAVSCHPWASARLAWRRTVRLSIQPGLHALSFVADS